jgi:serine/threonine-protein kinase
MATQTQIDSLVLQYEELRGQGVAVSADELCRGCPELLAELRRQIAMLESMNALLGDANGAAAATDAGTRTASSPRETGALDAMAATTQYRDLRLHAAGGLGEVLVARDEALDRQVALKRLQAPHTHNAQSRRRFLREAEITSRLEHPSIVPVHAVGVDSAGRPFYAMRFIEGETLRQASQRFHTAQKTDGESPECAAAKVDTGGSDARREADRKITLRQLLSRFIAVCNTVGYAHSQGIVHRDIKPDNIVLGSFGETLLVDWGLAKDIRTPDKETVGVPDAVAPEANESSTLADENSGTRPGAIVGTPGYMSPEQASGNAMAIGPASDIYSLGATLYMLIAGEAPFAGGQVAEILDRVKHGAFALPRQRKQEIAPALEAICLKAMSLAPEHRYATPLALAADIEQWLADQPVSAWPDPWTSRVRRWSGRHRTVVATGIAAAAVALVSLAMATILLNAANQREREARWLAQQNEQEAQNQRRQAELQRDEARKQRERAAHNFQLARQAVDQYCRRVAEDPRLREYDLEELRKGLLQTATQFCDELVRGHSDDPGVLAEQGRAYLLLGFVTDEAGAKTEAIAHYQKARGIFAALTAAHPMVRDYQRKLADSDEPLATLLGATAQPAAARKELAVSLESRDQLVHAAPADADYQEDLAATHLRLGLWYKGERQWRQAQDEFNRSGEIRNELLRRYPGVAAYQLGLGEVHSNLAITYRAMKQPARVEEELLKSLSFREQLVQSHPHVGEYVSKLAVSHNNLGILYTDLHRTADAEASLKKALALRQELVRTHPTVTDYQSKLARTYHNLGVLYHEHGRPAEADIAYRDGLTINKKLVEIQPAVTDYAVDLGKSYGRLGHLTAITNPQAALALFEQSIRAHETVLKRQPRHPECRECVGYSHAGRADALTKLHRCTEAIEAWDRALGFALGPNREEWQANRANTQKELVKERTGNDTTQKK